MRILYGCDTYYPNVNGASYFTQRLAAGLRREGNSVHVVCPSQTTRSTVGRRNEVVIHGIASLTTPFYPALRFSPLPFAYKRIYRVVQRVRPDIIHIQDHFFIGRALTHIAAKLNIPIVATNHFIPENLTSQLGFPTEGARKAVNYYIWKDLRNVFNRANLVTTPSSVGEQLLKRKGINRTVTAVSCGVDLKEFHPQQRCEAFNARYHLKALPTYMYVGRLDREKHIDELIKALPLVQEKVEAQLVIVGRGKQRRHLGKLAKSEQVSDSVIFTGFLADDELPRAYSACDVFCLAGTAELQSLGTMEAMATGKPVIAANAMALPWLVRDGINGYTFEPGDIETLAIHLIELLTNGVKREAMGQRSLEAVAHHRIENTFSAYRELYDAALNCRGPGLASVSLRGTPVNATL
jgi:glycosyltransferase involved in cell wall biosynthesis